MARTSVVGMGLMALMCGLLSSAAWAQQASGIAGVVRDPSGGVLPGVTVEAASPALIEKVRSAVTDGEGRYNIVDLRPGTYVVTFSLAGFNTLKRDGIALTAAFDPETQDRQVVNPKRKALKEEIRRVTQDIQTLEAQLGRALEANDERRRPTARGLKIAHARLRRTIAQRQQVLARLEHRLRRTPGQIAAAAAAVGKTRSLLREDRRLVVNALKLAAYNAERLSALRFNQYYRSSKDVLSVFRALLHLPGTVRPTDGDRLEVCLQRPDSRKSPTPSKTCWAISIRTSLACSATGRSSTSPCPALT